MSTSWEARMKKARSSECFEGWKKVAGRKARLISASIQIRGPVVPGTERVPAPAAPCSGHCRCSPAGTCRASRIPPGLPAASSSGQETAGTGMSGVENAPLLGRRRSGQTGIPNGRLSAAPGAGSEDVGDVSRGHGRLAEMAFRQDGPGRAEDAPCRRGRAAIRDCMRGRRAPPAGAGRRQSASKSSITASISRHMLVRCGLLPPTVPIRSRTVRRAWRSGSARRAPASSARRRT